MFQIKGAKRAAKPPPSREVVMFPPGNQINRGKGFSIILNYKLPRKLKKLEPFQSGPFLISAVL